MTDHQTVAVILPAEPFGVGHTDDGGVLDVGGVKVPFRHRDVLVYVRRLSTTLEVVEIQLAAHDGLAQEHLDSQNEEADRYPLGPKEYWRSEMVGIYTYGADGHVMTDDDFESDWED